MGSSTFSAYVMNRTPESCNFIQPAKIKKVREPKNLTNSKLSVFMSNPKNFSDPTPLHPQYCPKRFKVTLKTK